jgi:hypothetical protein
VLREPQTKLVPIGAVRSQSKIGEAVCNVIGGRRLSLPDVKSVE